MTNQADATTDHPHGEPMTSQADPQTTTQAHGEPMPDQDEQSNELNSNGEPMTSQADTKTETHADGDPMPETDESMADTERTLTPEIAARAALTGITCELGHDEVRVLTRIAERLRDGHAVHGQLVLTRDLRTFRLVCAWLKTETHLEMI